MKASQSPTLQFIRLVLRSRLPVPRRATRRLPRGVRDAVWSIAAVSFAAATVGLVLLAAVGPGLQEQPASDALIDLFFRATFVPMMFLVIAGYIASLKADTSRTREHVLLNSLPLSMHELHRLFLLSSVSRNAWLPLGMVLLLSTLEAVAPSTFVIRLNVLTLAAYVTLRLMSMVAHLALSLRSSTGRRAFPAASVPWVELIVMLLYATVPMVGILHPGLVSGAWFWPVVAAWACLIGLLLVASGWLFRRWTERSVVLRSHGPAERRPRLTYRAWDILLGRTVIPGKSNPMLIKNLIRAGREESFMSGMILGLLFVTVAFLVAMNNDRIDDAVAVLSGMFSLYAFFAVTRAMGRLGAEDEPPALVFSAPVTRAQLYLSVFLPLTVWLTAIALTLGAMVILAGGTLSLAGRFLSISLVMLLLFGSVGISVAVASYPRGKDAINRFVGWMLVVAVLAVVLYAYRLVVVLAAVATSLLLLRKGKLYRAR